MARIISVLAWLICVFPSLAQVALSPSFPSANDEVVITFDATQGSGNLAGYAGDLYAHTGVIVEGNPEWQYVIGGWGNNSIQPKLTRVAPNTYTLTISPTVREFYNVPADKKILRMCFVFRASNNSLQSEDLFYDVYEDGLNVIFSSPSSQIPIFSFGTIIPIEVDASLATVINLYVDNEVVASSDGEAINYDHTADSYGKTWIKVVASDGITSVADSVYYYVMGDVPVASMPDGLLPGINIADNDEVILVLHDPPALKEFVFAVGCFSKWELDEQFLMNRTPDGTHFWVTIDELYPMEEYIYQFWIDGELRIADPYTHKVSDPWHDKWISSTTYPDLISYPEGKTTGIASVLQIYQPAYEWSATAYTPPPKEELVIYELHIRDFVDDDYIVSVIEKLDYLETLGVNAIELMPINEFEGNDSWGYNPSFYFATDKAYGTKNDYKRFIDECHKRGIAVIVDKVLNHSFAQSPFVQMYFNPSAGQWGQPTADNPWYNETCPHEPWCWGFDFDHESQYTQDLIDRIAEYWLTEFRVDGFRLDFTKGFTNAQTGNQGANYDAVRVAILERFADHIWSVNPDAYVILEHFTENSEEKELAEYRADEGKGMLIWGNMNHAYNEATMGWLSNSNFSGISYKQRGWSVPHLVGYMESHDEERMMYKNLAWGNSENPNHDVKSLSVALNRQKLAGLFYFTVPGPKMIWQFGELGYDYPINYCPDGSIDEACRVGRKPIGWDFNDNWRRRSLYNAWAEFIALRHAFPVFHTDEFEVSLSGAGKQIRLFHNEMDVVIVGNFDVESKAIAASFPYEGTWYEYFSQSDVQIESTSNNISMKPGEYRMYTSVPVDRSDYQIVAVEQNVNPPESKISVRPNPIKNELTISVRMEKSSPVYITLYNLQGRTVDHVYSGDLSEGDNTINWIRGGEIPSGLYILSTRTNNSRHVNRLILR